jgi:hypothetical protein
MVKPALELVAFLALGAACFPPPLDETGLLCDDTRPCDTDYQCFDNVCYRVGEVDAGPDNWLTNPSFEQLNDAGTQAIGWVRGGTGNLLIDRAQARTGLNSAKLLAFDGGSPNVLTRPAPVLATLPNQTWCARAYIKANTDDGGVAGLITVREALDDGGTLMDYPGPRTRAGTQDWVMVNAKATTMGAPKLDVRVGFTPKPADGTQWLWVDDVQLKRSIDGTCTWQ